MTPAIQVTEAMIEAALKARVPGGAQVWWWLPTDRKGQAPHLTAQTVIRCALEAALAMHKKQVEGVDVRELAVRLTPNPFKSVDETEAAILAALNMREASVGEAE